MDTTKLSKDECLELGDELIKLTKRMRTITDQLRYNGQFVIYNMDDETICLNQAPVKRECAIMVDTPDGIKSELVFSTLPYTEQNAKSLSTRLLKD